MTDISSFVTQSGVAPMGKDIQIDKLFGQASARQYFRAHADDWSAVVMLVPQGFSSPAEEVTKLGAEAPREFSFLNVHRYLKSIGVAVPDVLAVDEAKGLILLEDLGDKMLEDVVRTVDGEFFVFYYRQAIETLVDLQERALEHGVPQSCLAAHRKFDADLLNWEFRHFLEYGIEDRFGVKVPADVQKFFDERTSEITRRIVALPQGLVHRDFQSRNLMLKNYRFHVIDFQDALMGPMLYDLVALLRDSYIDFSPEIRDRLLNEYVQQLPENHPYYGKAEAVTHDFHLITLQRKMKDAGRFQYIKTVRGNPDFIKHTPLTLRYVREAFAALPEFDDIRQKLSEWIAEWR